MTLRPGSYNRPNVLTRRQPTEPNQHRMDNPMSTRVRKRVRSTESDLSYFPAGASGSYDGPPRSVPRVAHASQSWPETNPHNSYFRNYNCQYGSSYYPHGQYAQRTYPSARPTPWVRQNPYAHQVADTAHMSSSSAWHAHEQQLMPDNNRHFIPPACQQSLYTYEQSPGLQGSSWNPHPMSPGYHDNSGYSLPLLSPSTSSLSLPYTPSPQNYSHLSPHSFSSGSLTQSGSCERYSKCQLPDGCLMRRRNRQTSSRDGVSKYSLWNIDPLHLPVTPLDMTKTPHNLTDAVTMYIDYLIAENENITRISQCKPSKQPCHAPELEEEPYVKDILKKCVVFPTAKFHGWLKAYNVDLQIYDVPAGEDPSMSCKLSTSVSHEADQPAPSTVASVVNDTSDSVSTQEDNAVQPKTASDIVFKSTRRVPSLAAEGNNESSQIRNDGGAKGQEQCVLENTPVSPYPVQIIKAASDPCVTMTESASGRLDRTLANVIRSMDDKAVSDTNISSMLESNSTQNSVDSDMTSKGMLIESNNDNNSNSDISIFQQENRQNHAASNGLTNHGMSVNPAAIPETDTSNAHCQQMPTYVPQNLMPVAHTDENQCQMSAEHQGSFMYMGQAQLSTDSNSQMGNAIVVTPKLHPHKSLCVAQNQFSSEDGKYPSCTVERDTCTDAETRMIPPLSLGENMGVDRKVGFISHSAITMDSSEEDVSCKSIQGSLEQTTCTADTEACSLYRQSLDVVHG